MSEKNVEVVRQILEHWERHEWTGGRELYDDRCEVVFSTAWLPDPDSYVIGNEALGAWISFLDSFEKFTVGVDRIVDAGESVVGLSWIRARGASQRRGRRYEGWLHLQSSGREDRSVRVDRQARGSRCRWIGGVAKPVTPVRFR